MIIKTFTADSWEAAEEKMLEAIGPEAIVLNRRRNDPLKGKGSDAPAYEITAGIEGNEKKNVAPLVNYSLEEIEKIIDNLQIIEELPAPSKKKAADSTESFSGLCETLWHELADTDKAVPFAKLVDNLAKSTKPLMAMETLPSSTWSLMEFLTKKGISVALAQKIDASIQHQFGTLNFGKTSFERDQALHFLCRELSRALRVFGPITFDGPSPKVVALVGPSGSGKSTTAFKLAYTHAQELKKRVMIIALENPSSPHPYQKAPTTLGQVPVRRVNGKQELCDLLDEIQENVDLVVIDTFSCNPYSWKAIDMMTSFLSAVPAEIHMIISAVTKDTDAIGMVQRYAPLAPASFILTKVDETAEHGVLINICNDTHLPVSYLTTGPQTTKGLEIADVGNEARRVLLSTKN